MTFVARTGGTWVRQTVRTISFLRGIACSSVSRCIVGGGHGWIMGTVDGGATWTQQPSATGDALRSISCVGESPCTAVGDNGVNLRRL
jgi:photosystem II stability/assembly factor-like uncharacterized protein